eukprot:277513_1
MGAQIKTPTMISLKGTNANENELTPKYLECGGRHTLLLTTTGLLLSWGWGKYGQLGNGSTSDQYTPTIVESIRAIRIVNIGVGYYHNICIAG